MTEEIRRYYRTAVKRSRNRVQNSFARVNPSELGVYNIIHRRIGINASPKTSGRWKYPNPKRKF
jgi:hypothetical protein